MRLGYQCGMLWGSSLAVGAESFRRYDNPDKAMAVAISTTQHIMKSYKNRLNTIECAEVTECDFNSKISMAKYMLTGKFLSCFKLAEGWAPDALQAAKEGLLDEQSDYPQSTLNCATEVVKKMGGSDEQAVMVAGFAGGLGLSGSGCGALAAAIWMSTFKWCGKNSGKSGYPNQNATKTLENFYKATDYEAQCHKICGRRFETIDEHTEFIKNGGCEKLINALAQEI